MILIDALFINNGGGRILLDYLIAELEDSKLDVFYLLDDRIIDEYPEINKDRVKYLVGSYKKRENFYRINKSKFSKVLCFGNLPPNIKLEATVYTYFHNLIYLKIPKDFSLKERLKFTLKSLILKITAKNTDFWIVQSELIKSKLKEKFNFDSECVKVVPFYPQFVEISSKNIRKENRYLYVSNATPHKNHTRLVNAFCRFYDENKTGELVLTVNEEYPNILELIEKRKLEGYPILNIGFVDRLALQKEYLSSEYLIFPSLTESFGLGLIEAIECGCKVIAADLPYTYEVCDPSLIFNPFEENSILEAFQKTLINKENNPSLARIKNNINQIISLLK